ncbi:YciI family protein [Streptomyces sp. NPDC057445]|uniref:YciI family protein n=1 Tax=Streptomyces sp. NPDC057445 TaxID=3346136 RepID=UPI00368E7075
MFVLELTYTAPVERVDELLDAHVAWLDALYEEGLVIASGRKHPRDGGVLLAVGDDRARIERIAAADPFVAGGVCEYRITEFFATKTAPGLERYRQQLPGQNA